MKRKKISKNLVLILFVSSFVVVLLVSFYANSLIASSMRIMKDNIELRLMSLSERLADFVDFEELDRYRQKRDMDLPSYQVLRAKMIEFANEKDVLFVYFFRPAEKEDEFQYIIDNDFNDKTRVGLDTPPFNLETDPWIKTAMEGQTVCSGLGHYASDWDGLMTSYSPMFDNDGKVVAIAGVDIIDTHIVRSRRMVAILNIAQTVAVIAVFLSGFICLILFRREVERARKANEAKSRFLSRMSHEIRTPMNIILGLSRLALMEELQAKVRSYCADISDAAGNILGIINDILDFSKIEAEKLQITPAEYQFSSLVNDATNFIRTRLGNSNVRFFTDIDKNIPATIIGDVTRIRQILFNLLSNAAKYTNNGQITLSIRMESSQEKPHDDEKKLLIVTVTDTGIGIREEDMEKLFEDFTRFDLKKNKNIEGTGLGLAITLNLCRAMGGYVTARSEYGKGSVFTAVIPQVVKNSAPFTEIPYSGPDYETIDAARHFTFSAARLLIVDDLPANLIVAEGLLAPYKAVIDKCLSGEEAIDYIKQRDCDLVFMDDMMPELSGPETTARIRLWENENHLRHIPIVVLTANTMAGMKETFLNEGFDDFLAKPIDISALREILERWIPVEKRDISTIDSERKENQTEFPIINGVDTKRGVVSTGGTLNNYLAVLFMFRVNAEEKIPFFQTAPVMETLPVFATHVHAIKGASASIGASVLSEKAGELETAAGAGELVFIEKNLSGFLSTLTELIENIKEIEMTQNESAPMKNEKNAVSDVEPLLKEVMEALTLKKASSDILSILDKITGKPLDQKNREIMENISYNVLMNEYDKAREILERISL